MLSCMAWLPPKSSSIMSCKNYPLSCLALLLTLLSLSNSALAADINGDALALLALKLSITNAAGGNLQSWNSSTVAYICLNKWKGVKCSSIESTLRVTELRLPGLGLFGLIPLQTLGNLDALQTLSLHNNKLSGSLPSDLANCAALTKIILNENSFSGPLPQNFSAWPLLRNLDLSSNNFSGQIPSSLSSSTSLRKFSVADNHLNGSIPSALSTRFSAESFAGNADLCGAPLAACTSTQAPAHAPTPQPSGSSNAPTPQPSGSSNNADNGDHNKKLQTGAIVGIVVGAVAASIVLLSVFWLLFARKKKKQGHAEDLYADGRAEFDSKTKGGAITNLRVAAINRKGSGKSGENEGSISINNKLIFMGTAKQTFDLDDLLRASAEVLGKGSLGTSYKALMDEGKPLSVKRFREVATERDETSKHIEMLGALQHANLVPLRAYFFAPKGKLLVSEYMPKGDLSSLLHGKKGLVKELLSWEARLAIAGGAAKGVVFLHSKKIVHGNIKSTNVVMDSENQARLTDYSLVQLLPRGPASSLKPNAYTPPESRGDLRKVTYKGDVYAFGVLLIELVTGLSPLSNDSNIDELVQWVQGHVPHHVESVIDPLLVANSDDDLQDEMVSLLHIALPCVSPAPEKRPHMVEVVSSIENLRKHDDGPDSTDFYFTQTV